MHNWLLHPEKEDVRFRLRRLLHDSATADRYDYILLDCPPRMTTAAVNALASADFVLIPTIPDKDSSARIPFLLKYLQLLKPNVCPELEVLGVVGNMARYWRKHLIAMHENYWNELKEKLLSVEGKSVHQFDSMIPYFGGKWQQNRFGLGEPFVNLMDECLRRIPQNERRLAEVVS